MLYLKWIWSLCIKYPKRERKFKGRFKPRRPINCLYTNEEEEEEEESNQSRSEDELGFVAIKEDDLDREIREESVLISQVEEKDWIIDNDFSLTWMVIWASFSKSKAMMEELSK